MNKMDAVLSSSDEGSLVRDDAALADGGWGEYEIPIDLSLAIDGDG